MNRLLPVFTFAHKLTQDEAHAIAARLSHVIATGECMILDAGVSLQFLDREPGEEVTFRVVVKL